MATDRFYIEFDGAYERSKGLGGNNCIAIDSKRTKIINGKKCYYGVGGVSRSLPSNTDECLWQWISEEYLRGYCKQVSPATTRRIHPNLWCWLKSNNQKE